MIPEPDPRLESALSKFSKVASAGVALAGAAVVIGWWLDTALLKSVFPGFATMEANTALAFLLSGTSLWLLQPQQPSQPRRRIAQACAGTVVLVGMLTLAQDFFGWKLHIDELLFRDTAGGVKTPHPDRVAANTASNFAVIGCALMTTDPLGIITDGNQRPEALTGCTREELMGAPFRNYFTGPMRAEEGIRQRAGLRPVAVSVIVPRFNAKTTRRPKPALQDPRSKTRQGFAPPGGAA